MRTVSSSKFPTHQMGSQSSRHVHFVACQFRVPEPCDDRAFRIPTVACQHHVSNAHQLILEVCLNGYGRENEFASVKDVSTKIKATPFIKRYYLEI